MQQKTLHLGAQNDGFCFSPFFKFNFFLFLGGGGIHGKSLMYPGTGGMFPCSFLGMMAWHASEFVNRVVEFIESSGVGGFDLFTAGTKNHMDDGNLLVFSIGVGG